MLPSGRHANPTSRLPVAAARSPSSLALVVAAACSARARRHRPSAAPPIGNPTPGASASPSRHPAPRSARSSTRPRATDVVLRLEQGGGFVPIDFLATQAPSFTLYGNGVIVFQQNAVRPSRSPTRTASCKQIPWRTATLDEGQIQELLEFALGPGGLGTARDTYIDGGIADAPDTIFTIHAGGVDKTVVVNALGRTRVTGPDALARAAFSKLAERLQDFDQGGTINTDVYHGRAIAGLLIDRGPSRGIAAVDWPWPALTPADFKDGANDGSGPAARSPRIGR